MNVSATIATLGVVALLLAGPGLLKVASLPNGAKDTSPFPPATVAPAHDLTAPGPTRPLGYAPAITGVGRLVVSTADAQAFPNDGLRVNLTAFPPAEISNDASFQVAVEESIGGYDAVFGLFENVIYPVVPFFSVFSNTTDQPMHLAYWTNLSLLSGIAYDFEIQPWNGTVWQLTVNGQVFGGNGSDARFDFGATQSTWIGGMSFSEIALYPTVPTAPPVLSATLTFAVHRPSGWYLPTGATTTISEGSGSGWGIAGRLQNPVLAPGATVSGTSVPIPGNSTDLWSGGPVAIGVGLTVLASAVSLTAVTIVVRTQTAVGGALPGVAIALSDQLGGSFTPAGLVTDTGASSVLAFQTPNVSAPSPDPVTVRVTTFGYVASMTVAVELTPAAHILLVPDGGTEYLAPGQAIQIGWTTRAPNGTALPGILVTFGASSGTVEPVFASSDGSGHIATTLNGSIVRAGYVSVQAIVASQGAWGKDTVNVTVGAAPPPAWWAPYVEPAIVSTAALVAAAALFIWWWRRPRTPLPPMALPRRRRLPTPAAPPVDPTRTPP